MSCVQIKSRRLRTVVGGPGLGGTDPERPARSLSGEGPTGPSLQPRSRSIGRWRHWNLPPPQGGPPPALPSDSGEGRRGTETPIPPRTQLGRHSPHPGKPCPPVPTRLRLASSRVGRSGQGGRFHGNTNLAIEGFHSLHVVGAEAPSPAAEEAAATALGGES